MYAMILTFLLFIGIALFLYIDSYREVKARYGEKNTCPLSPGELAIVLNALRNRQYDDVARIKLGEIEIYGKLIGCAKAMGLSRDGNGWWR